MGRWWTREFSWSQDRLEEIGIEAREGGFAYERGPHGFTIHWGRVLTCEVPQRIVFTWQIAPDRTPQPDPDRASEVEVVFTGSADDGTDVALEDYESDLGTFPTTLPDGNVLDYPPGDGQTLAGGVYVILRPLDAGTHRVAMSFSAGGDACGNAETSSSITVTVELE